MHFHRELEQTEGRSGCTDEASAQLYEDLSENRSENNMRVRVLGDKMGLAPDIRKRIAELEEATKDYDGLNFQIALNYGGQDEIVRAVRKVMADTQKGLQPEDMTIESSLTIWIQRNP